MTTNNDFNRKSHVDVQNRITPYNLNENEQSKIWALVEKKEKSLSAELKDYNNNKDERKNKEYLKLKYKREFNHASQNKNPKKNRFQPEHLDLTLDPPNFRKGKQKNTTRPNKRDRILQQKAWDNVLTNHLETIDGIHKSFNKHFDQILDNARKEGRGPKSQFRQEFQKAHDHDHER